jgi:hypothetical protein
VYNIKKIKISITGERYTGLLYDGLSKVRNSEDFPEKVIRYNIGVLDSFKFDLQFLNEIKLLRLSFRCNFSTGHELGPLFLVSFDNRCKQALENMSTLQTFAIIR